MRRPVRLALAILALGVAVGLGFRLWAVFESRGCPLALLRDPIEDRLVGHPAEVRRVEEDFGGGRSITTTVSTYTRDGNLLRRVVQDASGVQTTTYLYNRRGWLTGSQTAAGSTSGRTQYMYLPSKHRIEIATSYETPGAVGAPASAAGPSGWLARLRERLHPTKSPPTVFRQVIQLDSRNRYRYADQTESGGWIPPRTVYVYDRSGRIERKTEVGWCINIYKRNARGDVVEEKRLHATGKPADVVCSVYKYDAVGNWIERRNTALRPGATGRKPTLSSVTTRTIKYWP